MLYTAYQIGRPAEKIYSYFQYDFFWDIHVQDMLSVGREELWGDFSYKQQIQAEYKRKFPKHSSFQSEMREYC